MAQPDTLPRVTVEPEAFRVSPHRQGAVSEVTSADLLEILTPLWHRKVATAKRVRQRLRAVLEWAVAMEYRIDNPCDRIGPVLGPQRDLTEPMQAVPHRAAATAIRKVRISTALPAARLALEFLVLTAARWSEVGWAEWKEIDREGKVWTVPAGVTVRPSRGRTVDRHPPRSDQATLRRCRR